MKTRYRVYQVGNYFRPYFKTFLFWHEIIRTDSYGVEDSFWCSTLKEAQSVIERHKNGERFIKNRRKVYEV